MTFQVLNTFATDSIDTDSDSLDPQHNSSVEGTGNLLHLIDSDERIPMRERERYRKEWETEAWRKEKRERERRKEGKREKTERRKERYGEKEKNECDQSKSNESWTSLGHEFMVMGWEENNSGVRCLTCRNEIFCKVFSLLLVLSRSFWFSLFPCYPFFLSFSQSSILLQPFLAFQNLASDKVMKVCFSFT